MGMLARLREKRLLWPTFMTLAALPILVSLGMWQLERKAWKEALIAALSERMRAEPTGLLNAYTASYGPPFDVIRYEYMRVSARGRFHHDKERFLYAPDQKLGPGYNVVTPFELSEGGSIVLVNRGFVPDALKEPAARAAGQVAGEVEIKGLLRAPQAQDAFAPDNDAKANLWFWRDFAGMLRSAFPGAAPPSVPVFLDVEAAAPGGWPKGGATLVNLPNRHLEYAITWLGLAGVLAAIYAAYAVQRLRER